jgi:hypothetical protein
VDRSPLVERLIDGTLGGAAWIVAGTNIGPKIGQRKIYISPGNVI